MNEGRRKALFLNLSSKVKGMVLIKKMKLPVMLMVFVLLASTPDAQRVIVNGKGEKVIMYPDGSWRHAEAGDSLLIRQHVQKSGAVSSEATTLNTGTERNEAEEQEYFLRQWNELYASLLNEDKRVQDDFRTATNAKFKAEEKLQTAEANKKLMEPDKLARLQEEFNLSINNLGQAKLKQKDFKALLKKANKINQVPSKINQKKINQVKSGYVVFLGNYDPGRKVNFSQTMQIPQENAKSMGSKKPELPVASVTSSSVAEPYSPEMQNVLPAHAQSRSYLAQPFECIFITDTIDRATGRRKIVLEPSLLFTHTDPDLRPYFKEKELISCNSHLFENGPYTYLTLYFQIASSHAQSNFGSLDNGSLLRLRLMNGEYLSLYNIKTDKGKIDAYSGNTLFSAQYPVGKSEIKKLRSSGVDKIRVFWATGYEDYDIYLVDSIKNQLDCLSSKK